MNDRCLIRLVDEEIQPARFLGEARLASCGGVVVFLGTVRSPSNGREILGLVYESYRDMALMVMERISEESLSRWDLGRVVVIHRLGNLSVGEISLMIAVSSPHRRNAYEASRFILEEIKQEVPIWKKERWAGGEAWV
jgi:molybdopterin synthase catalytic subunit